VTTLELAEILEELARILRRLPDSELSSAMKPITIMGSKKPEKVSSRALGGISLARISKYPKSELIKLIKENQIPIEVRAKDSAENVLRRLRNYLEENRNSKRKIRNQVVHGKTSPELSSALSYLLKDRYE
jgi:hypothetical protein